MGDAAERWRADYSEYTSRPFSRSGLPPWWNSSEKYNERDCDNGNTLFRLAGR